MPPLTPQQRRMRARIAAATRWSNTPDRQAAMKKATAGFLARFDRQVDPEGTLDPELRRKLADAALSAHMTRLALKSSQVRSAAAPGQGDSLPPTPRNRRRRDG